MMRRSAAALALAVALAPTFGLASGPAGPDEVVLDMPLSVLDKPENRARIGGDIAIQFADGPTITPMEGRLKSNRKVRNTTLGVERDCEAALVQAVEGLADLARKRGGARVVGVRSFWRGYPTASAATYKCGRGRSITGVSFIGNLGSSK
jgi:hypothetical protein